MLELIERLQPIIDFTHSTAFSIFLCSGWFITYLVMSFINKRMRKQCDKLLRANKNFVKVSDLANDEVKGVSK